ncbi:MAG: hypothetical protein ACK4ZW_06665 [Blastomonas sp.]|jgi:hypothetical protein
MVDNFAIAVSHLLVALAAWRLVWRADLDKEDPPARDDTPSGFFGTGARVARKGDTDA